MKLSLNVETSRRVPRPSLNVVGIMALRGAQGVCPSQRESRAIIQAVLSAPSGHLPLLRHFNYEFDATSAAIVHLVVEASISPGFANRRSRTCQDLRDRQIEIFHKFTTKKNKKCRIGYVRKVGQVLERTTRMLVMRTSSLRSATCTDTLALLAMPKRYGYSCKKYDNNQSGAPCVCTSG